ncbi:hypothetical protein NCC49_004703 [Naganishia albida]|nr:hypothetical protein NCC49_004703 [Naganishia albida]
MKIRKTKTDISGHDGDDAKLRTASTLCCMETTARAGGQDTSGPTSAHLSTLFGPLIFGLTDSTHSSAGVGTFIDTHSAYVRSSRATEHFLLAWIRKQEAEHERLKGHLPQTLSAWAKEYPLGIMDDQTLDLGEARKGEPKARVVKAQRMMRSYSKDLLASCGDWAAEWADWGKVVRDGVVLTDIHQLRLGMKNHTLPSRTMGRAERNTAQEVSTEGGTSLRVPDLWMKSWARSYSSTYPKARKQQPLRNASL